MIFRAAEKIHATMLASIYPRKRDNIITIANDTGLKAAKNALSKIIIKMIKAKIIVSMPIISIL